MSNLSGGRIASWLLFCLGCAGATPTLVPVGKNGTVLLSEQPFGEGPLRVRHFRLRNGATVLLLSDPATRAVSLRSCLGMGVADDPPGRRGMAHLVEHLVYRQDPDGHIDELSGALGGAAGAYTSINHTCYSTDLPRDALSPMVAFDSWRLAELRLEQHLLDSERDRVLVQEQGYRHDLDFFLHHRLWALAHDAYPAHLLAARWQAEVRAITREDAQRFFHTHYVPQNLTVVLAGGFSEAEVLPLLEQHYGALAAGSAPPAAPWQEPVPGTERRLNFSSESLSADLLLVGYRTVSLSGKDVAALEVLAELLEARLGRRFDSDEDVVRRIKVRQLLDREAGMLSLRLTLGDDGYAQDVEPLVNEELERIRERSLEESEVAAARIVAETNAWRRLETTGERADALARHQLLGGDYRLLFRSIAAVRGVSAGAVGRAARRYLLPERRAVLIAQMPRAERSEAP